ncbi:MAG: hypothetical protein KUG59_07030 [Parvibaculaceae bacterium]|nr:hypothetical protein [Parvibaculaceae bacterium]
MLSKKSVIAGLAALSFFFAAPAAWAQGDLVFMHNASPYFVWSDLEQCIDDLKNVSNGCDSFTYRSFCGTWMFSSTGTSNVAKLRLNRGDKVKLFHNNGTNNVYCTVQP